MDETIGEAKTRVRAAALARRDGLGAEARAAGSAALAALPLPVDVAGRVVSAFVPIRSEIDPGPLVARLVAAGARLALPRIEDGRLVFRAHAPDAPLEPGGFGTRVPPLSAAIVDPEVMLVPLAAFDRRCARLGYGKGYYDGALAALAARGRPPTTIGLAFRVQEADAVPEEAHDRRLDAVLTEAGLVVSPEGALRRFA